MYLNINVLSSRVYLLKEKVDFFENSKKTDQEITTVNRQKNKFIKKLVYKKISL